MSNRKHSDAKRFGFCTRCLLPTSPERLLIEHHLFGRKNDHTAIVFICTQCNPFVESLAGPIPDESRALQEKRDLFVQSSALRWFIRNWQSIATGILDRNQNGVSVLLGPHVSGWQPPFGAVGNSGRRYYFIPPDHCDDFVESFTERASDDGVGGPAAGGQWVRFKGGERNILNKILDIHASQGSPGINLELVRQD